MSPSELAHLAEMAIEQLDALDGDVDFENDDA
jgi:hypothetical protein